MLVITRKIGEAIIIGQDIEVRVLRIGRDGVRLGVTASPHVTIHRREVYEQIRAANASAAARSDVLTAIVAQLRERASELPSAAAPPDLMDSLEVDG